MKTIITVQCGKVIKHIETECFILATANKYKNTGGKKYIAAQIDGHPKDLVGCFISMFRVMPKLVGLAAVAVSHLRRN